jgi:hypothetical protein
MVHPVIGFVNNINKLNTESFEKSEIPSTLSELKEFLKSKGYTCLRWSYRKTSRSYRLGFEKYWITHEIIFMLDGDKQGRYRCIDTFISCSPAPTKTIDLFKGMIF